MFSSVKASTLTDNIQKKYFNEKLAMYAPAYTKIADVVSSTRSLEQYLRFSGAGYLGKYAKGAEIPTGEIVPSYQTTLYNEDFGKELEFAYQDYEDDQYGAIKDASSKLGEAASIEPDRRIFSIFRNGFNSDWAGKYYNDGKTVFNDAHPSKGDATFTQGNVTNAVLNVESLDLAIQSVKTVKDDDKKMLNIMPTRCLLIVGPKLARRAMELAMSEQSPLDANNAINYFVKGIVCDVLVTPWISELGVPDAVETVQDDGIAGTAGSDLSWFVMTPELKNIVFQTRKPFNSKMYEVENPHLVKFKTEGRFTYGLKLWQGMYGSSGDGAALPS